MTANENGSNRGAVDWFLSAVRADADEIVKPERWVPARSKEAPARMNRKVNTRVRVFGSDSFDINCAIFMIYGDSMRLPTRHK